MPNVRCHCSFFGVHGFWSESGQSVKISVKQMALLAKLAASDHLEAPRGELASLLWPDSCERAGRHSLSQALYDLKSRVGSEVVYADQEALALGKVTSDIRAFQDNYVLGRWEAASRYYEGPFLSSFVLDGCLAFQHWVDGIRAHYQTMSERVLEAIYQEGNWEAVLNLADVLSRHDPQNARLAALRLGAIAEIRGKPAAFASLREVPESRRTAVEEMWSRLDRARCRPADGNRSAFVGRNEEIEFLKGELERAESVGHHIVLIEGEPGIGKTALATRFARSQTLQGVLCLLAKATEAERNVPFAVVDQWLRDIPDRHLISHSDSPWWDALRAVFPMLPTVDVTLPPDPASLRQILEALRRLFNSFDKIKATVLVIDDAHLADTASLSFLTYLVSQESRNPTLSLLTVRREATRRILSFVDLHSAARLHLGPITEQDLDGWLLRVGIADQSARSEKARSLLSLTGGNPLLISALLEVGGDLEFDRPPSTVVDYFEPIILKLPTIARSLLSVLSIIGEAVPTGLLSKFMGVTADAANQAVEQLIGANLVMEADGLVSLRHGLIADVTIALTPDSEKRRLHGRAARLFDRGESTGVAMAAVSYDIAGDRADAYAAAMQAAKACATLSAHDERLFFLKLAVSNAPGKGDAIAARLKAGEVLLQLGRPHEVTELLDEQLIGPAAPTALRQIQIQRIRASVALAATHEELQQLWFQCQGIPSDIDLCDLYTEIGSVAHDFGSDALSAQILDTTWAVLERCPRSVDQARLLLRPILITGIIGDCGEAFEELVQLDHFLTNDPGFDCMFRAVKGSLWVSAGQVVRAEEEFTEALFIAERHALYDKLFLIYNNLGVCFIEQGRYSEAEEQLTRAKEFGSSGIHPTNYSLASDNLSILLYESGRYEDALDLATQGANSYSGKGRRTLISSYSLMGLAQLRLGRLGHAREVHRELRLLQSDRHPVRTDLSYMHIFQARMLVADEDPISAINYLDNATLGYQNSLALTRWRLQLEAHRLRVQVGLPPSGLYALKLEMSDSGATPLTCLADSLMRRSNQS